MAEEFGFDLPRRARIDVATPGLMGDNHQPATRKHLREAGFLQVQGELGYELFKIIEDEGIEVALYITELIPDLGGPHVKTIDFAGKVVVKHDD